MITENDGVDVDIYELADYLAAEIEESGKTRWSAKDVKNFFLSQGLNLSLDEILQVWDVCPSPVCASKLLGCNDPIFASNDYTAFQRESDMEEALTPILKKFMKNWGETIGDLDELQEIISSCVEHWAVSSGEFEY